MSIPTPSQRSFDLAVETAVAAQNDARLIPQQYPLSRARTIAAALIRRGWTPPESASSTPEEP